MVSRLVVKLITLYQKTISPDHGILKTPFFWGGCRFQPTCSDYAKQAVEDLGVIRGGALALKRIARCHPRGGEGFDPVPAAPGTGGKGVS